MHRIDNPSAATAMPLPPPPGPGGYFSAGDPTTGQEPTIVEADWLNTLQEELVNVVTASGATLNKNDNTQLLAALRGLFLARTVVTQNMTIYVNATTGNDINNGLTAGTAFKTLQVAIRSIYAAYDWNGHNCNIQLADGTYLASGTGGTVGYFQGNPIGLPVNGLTLTGNVALPGNVVLSGPNANCMIVSMVNLTVQGVTFTSTGTVNTPAMVQGYGLYVSYGSIVTVQSCRFQACGLAQISCSNAGTVIITGTAVVFTGATQYCMVIQVGGQIWYPNASINMTGLSASVAIQSASECGSINAGGAIFVGTPTGTRYGVSMNGVINTAGGGPNFLPGTVAGVASSGGQYV